MEISKVGAPPRFTHETLIKAFEDYLAHHDNKPPIIEVKPHAFNGEIFYSKVVKHRSITFQAFANFIKMSRTNFEKWRAREDMKDAMEHLEKHPSSNPMTGEEGSGFHH